MTSSNQAYSMQVLIQLADNRWVPIQTYGKDGKTYISGRTGRPFRIKFSNHSARRVLAVPSVDGISTINGKECDPQEAPGFVVPAYQSIEINGWSVDHNQSAQFVFSAKAGAYVATTAAAEQVEEDVATMNCGVIGCKVYSELVKEAPLAPIVIYTKTYQTYPTYPPTYPPSFYQWPYCWGIPSFLGHSDIVCNSGFSSQISSNTERDATAYSGSASIGYTGSVPQFSNNVSTASVQSEPTPEAPAFTLGTAWGDLQDDKTQSTRFERGEALAEFSVYYTSAEELQRIGIDVDKKGVKQKVSFPQAFTPGFCVAPSISTK